MSAQGMTATILAGELVEAVLADENGDGLDISAGLFGDATSAWLRKIAALLVEKDTEIARLKAK